MRDRSGFVASGYVDDQDKNEGNASSARVCNGNGRRSGFYSECWAITPNDPPLLAGPGRSNDPLHRQRGLAEPTVLPV